MLPGQPTSQIRPAPQHMDPDRRLGTTHGPGDILIRLLLDDVEHDGRSLAGWQPGDRSEDGLPKLVVLGTFSDRGRGVSNPLVGPFGRFAAQAAPASAGRVEGRRDGDPEDERLRIRMRGHDPSLLPNDGQGVLEGVLCGFAVPDDPPYRPEQPGLERLDEDIVVEFPDLQGGRPLRDIVIHSRRRAKPGIGHVAFPDLPGLRLRWE